MKGNWGKVLLVDLTKGTSEDVEIPEKDYRDYLGGSGLAAKWLFDHKGWEVDPLSPDNPLMIMMGPLSGLALPGASRLEFCARSPLTGIWGEASMGGHFAPRLKATGYDGIIVTGASDKPVYLYVTDSKVEIRDASHLWGKDSLRDRGTAQEKELGDKRAQVVSIGQGGESLVTVRRDNERQGSTAGRTGMGAVMGSKKLKAVVASGKKKPQIADEEKFKQLRDSCAKLKFSLVAEGLGAFGSNVHMEYGMAIGDVPTKNWTKAYWANGPKKLGGATVTETRLTKGHSCYACPVGCKRIVEVKSGPFTMEEGPGSEYEAAVAMGTDILVDDLDANLKANDLCDRYGIDVISTGSTIAWAIEAYEKGILTDKETGGIKLEWGNPQQLVDLVTKIARREGIGDILAEGTRAASEKYGGTEFAIHVKGMECPMHDPRALWGMALTYATTIRGACHCADANLYAEMGLVHPQGAGHRSGHLPSGPRARPPRRRARRSKSTLTGSLVMLRIRGHGVRQRQVELRHGEHAQRRHRPRLRPAETVIDTRPPHLVPQALLRQPLRGHARCTTSCPSASSSPHADGPDRQPGHGHLPRPMLTMGPHGQAAQREDDGDHWRTWPCKYLFPNIGKMLLVSMRFIPGSPGHRRQQPDRTGTPHRPLPADAGRVLPGPRHRPAGASQPQHAWSRWG